MEPLSFKGRRGSGIAGDRCGYRDAALRPRWDWQKYEYPLRVWGRMLYNPESDPDACARYLRSQFGAAAREAGEALAQATRILPTVTTAHGASAGNNTYWVEMYTNQPIVDPKRRHPYSDSPAPRVFGNVSPLDPQLFAGVNDCAEELLQGERSGKYSPIETAQWLEDCADSAARHLAQAEGQAANQSLPEWRRLAIDVAMQIDLGRFYAAKLRSGVLYGIHERSGDRVAIEEALRLYRSARAIWAGMAERAANVYVPDITIGEETHLRGHWLDRLPAMDGDLADMAARLGQAGTRETRPERVTAAVKEALGRPQRPSFRCHHTPPATIRAGQPLQIELLLFQPEGISARLYYRHVNQAERFIVVPMRKDGNRLQAVIPGTYTPAPYPLQYYFELREGPQRASLYPEPGQNFTNQPYFTVRRA
jgi:hypothetical protein